MAGVDYEWLIAQLALRHKVKIMEVSDGWWAVQGLTTPGYGPYHCEETAVLKACERYGIDVNEQMDDVDCSKPVRSLFDVVSDLHVVLTRLDEMMSPTDGQPDSDMDCNGDVCSF